MIEMTQVFAYEAFQRIEALAKETLASVETGDMRGCCRCSKLTRCTPVDTVALKRDRDPRGQERAVHGVTRVNANKMRK